MSCASSSSRRAHGATPTTTISDARGRTIELRQHLGSSPAAPTKPRPAPMTLRCGTPIRSVPRAGRSRRGRGIGGSWVRRWTLRVWCISVPGTTTRRWGSSPRWIRSWIWPTRGSGTGMRTRATTRSPRMLLAAISALGLGLVLWRVGRPASTPPTTEVVRRGHRLPHWWPRPTPQARRQSVRTPSLSTSRTPRALTVLAVGAIQRRGGPPQLWGEFDCMENAAGPASRGELAGPAP